MALIRRAKQPDLVEVGFSLGFDPLRYERMSGHGIASVEISTQVNAVHILDTTFSIPSATHVIDLRTRKDFLLSARMVNDLSGILKNIALKIGTPHMDCEAFVRGFLGDGELSYRGLPDITSFAVGDVVRMAPMIIDDIPSANGDHWFLGLDDGQTALHVAGRASPLMVTPVSVVEQMYPRRVPLLASNI